ncbi:polysaccharide biosynthesis/export family protein [Novosphingobium pokkalii]|uniref:polysaccharide biosynthesis/export family protein n=1 Tax=Novosphingobium pokkalii TaxID=1770194 RepID=UPI003630D64B
MELVKFPTIIAATFASAALSACATTPVGPEVATGADAYKVAPSISDAKTPESSPIGVGDELSLSVMGEPDLSFAKLVVDDAGRIQMPLAGSVKVSGLSPAEASRLIETKLGERYLKYPQVTINVNTAAEKFVSVEGQVNHAGAYPVNASTTLLGAVSMAQSPTRIAKLSETMVFRTVNGKRMVARSISTGSARGRSRSADPGRRRGRGRFLPVEVRLSGRAPDGADLQHLPFALLTSAVSCPQL